MLAVQKTKTHHFSSNWLFTGLKQPVKIMALNFDKN